MQLDNKTILVTGAARGIGRACALAFARQGASLILFDIAHNKPGVPYDLGSESQLNYTNELCKQAGAATLVAEVDICNTHIIEKNVAQALSRFGCIDVLLNNAGIAAPSGKIVDEIREDEWLLMMDVDLNGAWRMTKAVGKSMTARRQGSIINIASTAGILGYRHFSAYVAAKHGLIGLTKAAALDYAPTKVRVNAICPGSVRDDPLVEGKMLSEIARSLEVSVSDHEALFIQSQPMNSLIEPEDIANAAIWLASDASQNVTGSVLVVDGGYSSR